MKLKNITEEEAYSHLNEPFNPPAGQGDENAFSEEWLGVRDKLKAVLDGLGEFDAYGDGDYYLGETTGCSRGIGVYLTSPKMLNDALIPLVQNLLGSLPNQ